QQVDMNQVFEKTESCSSSISNLPQTKHVDLSEENVDKACLSISRAIDHVPPENVVDLAVDQTNHQPIGHGEWSDIQPTESRIADVREVASETERSSLDIPVVTSPSNTHQDQGHNSHQP
ncbi:hypothetical protein HAX54_001414, partial [Datura stramonium]|nr:hypothetical protein [Datura stramonium]